MYGFSWEVFIFDDFTYDFSWEVLIFGDFAYDFSWEVWKFTISTSHVMVCFEHLTKKVSIL